jgi:hypothetical protein
MTVSNPGDSGGAQEFHDGKLYRLNNHCRASPARHHAVPVPVFNQAHFLHIKKFIPQLSSLNLHPVILGNYSSIVTLALITYTRNTHYANSLC